MIVAFRRWWRAHVHDYCACRSYQREHGVFPTRHLANGEETNGCPRGGC